jgi:antitoxin ChpS
MITVHVRKQGGAAVITIPSDVLKMLDLEVGATLALDVTSKGFTARPISVDTRKRYSLTELLQGVTLENMKALKKETAWAREGGSVGDEIA